MGPHLEEGGVRARPRVKVRVSRGRVRAAHLEEGGVRVRERPRVRLIGSGPHLEEGGVRGRPRVKVRVRAARLEEGDLKRLREFRLQIEPVWQEGVVNREPDATPRSGSSTDY